MKMTSLPHSCIMSCSKTSHLYTQTFCIIEAIPQQCIVRAVNGTLWLQVRAKYRKLHINHTLTERKTWGESRLEGGLYKLSARKRNIIAQRGREGIEKRGKGGHSEVKKWEGGKETHASIKNNFRKTENTRSNYAKFNIPTWIAIFGMLFVDLWLCFTFLLGRTNGINTVYFCCTCLTGK